MSWIFENHTLKALNIPFKKVPGRVKYGIIFGPEGEIVVAHGRLPSPARTRVYFPEDNLV